MARLKRLGKIALFFGGGSILLLAASLATLYRFPGFILNTRSAAWALGAFAPEILTPSLPPNFSLRVRSPRWGFFRIEIQAGAFCLHVPNAIEKGCVETLNLTSVVHHRWPLEFEWVEFGPTQLISSEWILNDDPKPSPKGPEGESGLRWGLARNFHLYPSLIQLERLRLSHRKPEPVIEKIEIRADKIGAIATLLASFAARLSPQEQAEARAQFEFLETQEVRGMVRIGTRLPRQKASGEFIADVTGNFESGQAALSARGALLGPAPYFKKTSVRKLDAHRESSGALKLDSEFLTEVRLPGGKLGRDLALPLRWTLDAAFDREGQGEARLDLRGHFIPRCDLLGNGRATFRGGFRPATGTAELKLDLRSFQSLRKYFDGTPYEIPAPVRVLEGPVIFVARADYKNRPEGAATPPERVLAFPIELSSRLQSEEQRLNLNAIGAFELEARKIPRLKLKLDLHEVRLRAPSIDPVFPFPMPVGDSRIQKGSISERTFQKIEKKRNQPSLELDLDATSGQPIEVLHPIFDPSLRFKAKFSQTEDSNRLTLDFLPSKVSYVGRQAELKKLILTADSAKEALEFVGQLGMRRAGYDITLDFSQKDRKTVLDLFSEPPLEQDDIISLLLFNELSTELAEEDQRSVEDTQSAISRRALGFFSMWALSSTPVESVNYDPASQMYSAKLKLPGGLTGTVGSDWDRTREFELRKRLGKRWVISTGVTTDDEGESAQTSFLEWFYRY